MITTHDNSMWGVIVWSGDLNGDAAIISSSRLGTFLWTFVPAKKSRWMSKSKPCYWSRGYKYKNKEEAFRKLGVAPEK